MKLLPFALALAAAPFAGSAEVIEAPRRTRDRVVVPKSDATKLRDLQHERDRYFLARARHHRPYARIKVFARLARMDAEIARLRERVGAS